MILISFSIQAYNRVNEKRSNVGTNALKMLDGYIKTLEDDERKNWLCWALHGDGPLFFKFPSPMGSPTDHEDPEYQVSHRFMKSEVYLLIAFFRFLKVDSFLDLLLISPPPSLVSRPAWSQTTDTQKDYLQ